MCGILAGCGRATPLEQRMALALRLDSLLAGTHARFHGLTREEPGATPLHASLFGVGERALAFPSAAAYKATTR